MQKEDFLRPDRPGRSSAWYHEETRRRYSEIPGFCKFAHEGVVRQLSTRNDPELEAIRTVGFRQANGHGAGTPRMHHKFLVGCVREYPPGFIETEDDLVERVRPFTPEEAARVAAMPPPRNWAHPLPRPERTFGSLVPTSVWTGSFNPSWTASHSLENAVIIYDPIVAKAYYEEWAHVLALSEPLDWESEWIAPELRIGS